MSTYQFGQVNRLSAGTGVSPAPRSHSGNYTDRDCHCSHVRSVTQGKSPLQLATKTGTPENEAHHFCSSSIGRNLVTWPHLLLICHWVELSHMATSICKGGWECPLLVCSKRRNTDFGKHLNIFCKEYSCNIRQDRKGKNTVDLNSTPGTPPAYNPL